MSFYLSDCILFCKEVPLKLLYIISPVLSFPLSLSLIYPFDNTITKIIKILIFDSNPNTVDFPP
jgi:hypothetical protein